MPARECSRTACSRPAVSTLTYVYADSTAVLGPLSRSSEPHTYDLCREHSAGLTAPRGWRVIRVPGSADSTDDLVALAAAVRPARRGDPSPATPVTRDSSAPETPRRSSSAPGGAARTASTGRTLRAVRPPDEPTRGAENDTRGHAGDGR